MIGLRIPGKDAVMASVMTDFREIPNIPCPSPRILVEIRLLWVHTMPGEPSLGVILHFLVSLLPLLTQTPKSCLSTE